MSKKTQIKDTLCVLPFSHLATHPAGQVTPCCESPLNAENDGVELNLNYNSIEEIRSCGSFTKLKQDMLNGIENKACEYCYSREKQGIESKRNRENRRWGLTEKTLDYFLKSPLIYTEMRLGNTCNLKCLICNPWSSSKWNEDAEVAGYSKVTIDRSWFKNLKVYNDLSNHSNSLKHIWFNGGEPTLIKEHMQFLLKLVEKNKSKEITLEYHTNGTNLPPKLIELWQNFKQIKLSFSVDDIEERLYYQRFPSKHDVVVNNIINIKNEGSINTDIEIVPTVSLYNVYNLDRLYKFYQDEVSIRVNIINFLTYPSKLAIFNLPDQDKDMLLEKYSNVLPQSVLGELKYNFFKEQSQGLDKFINFTKSLDNHRNISILDYLPEYSEYF